MIDLTPLDVRKKHEDFKRILRGFDPQEVQSFLEMAAERMEELVRENIQLTERSEALQAQVSSQTGREQAVQDALVTAQELRSDMQTQSQRESDLVLAEAQTEARRMLNEAEAEVRGMLRDAQRSLDQGRDALEEMERRRGRFLKAFRQLLEREMDVVEVEEEREPLEDRTIDLDLGGGRHEESEPVPDHVADVAEQVADLFGEAEEAEEAPASVDPTLVDDSAAELPPMDLPIEELAAAYGSEEPAAKGDADTMDAEAQLEADREADEKLFLSLDEPEPEPEPEPDDDNQWG